MSRSLQSVRRELIEMNIRNRKKCLVPAKIKGRLIKTLKDKHSCTKQRLCDLNVSEKKSVPVNYDVLAESARMESRAFEHRISQLEVILYQENIKLHGAMNIKRQLQSRIKKYNETIYDVKYSIACALKVRFFQILQFGKLNFTIWKIYILKFEKIIQIISKK